MFGPASVHQAQVDPNQFPESTTTPCVARDGADFAALGGKIQEHAVPPSLRVKPGAKHPAWKTQLQAIIDEAVDQLINNMALREKVLLSRLPEGSTSLLKRFLTFQVRCRLKDQWLLKKRVITRNTSQAGQYEMEAAEIIMEALCEKLRDSCNLRVVKK